MIVHRFAALLCVLAIFYGQVSAAKPDVNRLVERIIAKAKMEDEMNADVGDFPWVVSVLNTKTVQDSCVGTLITSQWVLTTARCGEKISQSLKTTKVVAGSANLLFYSKNNTAQINQVINHPEFKTGKRSENDLSLIKLVSPLAVDNRTIQTACLYMSEEEPTKPFDNLVVSAFGFHNMTDHFMLIKSYFVDRSFDRQPYDLDNMQWIMAKGLRHSYCLSMQGRFEHICSTFMQINPLLILSNQVILAVY